METLWTLDHRELVLDLDDPARRDLLVQLAQELAGDGVHDGDLVAAHADRAAELDPVGRRQVDDDPRRVDEDDVAARRGGRARPAAASVRVGARRGGHGPRGASAAAPGSRPCTPPPLARADAAAARGRARTSPRSPAARSGSTCRRPGSSWSWGPCPPRPRCTRARSATSPKRGFLMSSHFGSAGRIVDARIVTARAARRARAGSARTAAADEHARPAHRPAEQTHASVEPFMTRPSIADSARPSPAAARLPRESLLGRRPRPASGPAAGRRAPPP